MEIDERRHPGPASAVMTGPLAVHEATLYAELVRRGYAASSVCDALRTARWLSSWMEHQRLSVAELTPLAVDGFLAARREVCRSEKAARCGLGAVLRVLRSIGVVPCAGAPSGTAADEVLADYRASLRGERNLAAESVRCYCSQAKTFLAWLPVPLEEALARLNAAQVTSFVVQHSAEATSVWSAKAAVTALRSLLRYLHVAGLIPTSLACGCQLFGPSCGRTFQFVS